MPPARKPAPRIKAKAKPSAIKKSPSAKAFSYPAARGAKGKASPSQKLKAQAPAAKKAPAKMKFAPAAVKVSSGIPSGQRTFGAGLQALRETVQGLSEELQAIRIQLKKRTLPTGKDSSAKPIIRTAKLETRSGFDKLKDTLGEVFARPGGTPTEMIPFTAAPGAIVTRQQFEMTRLQPASQKINPSMDPRLQFAVARAHAGMSRQAFVAAAPGEIPVVAQISDLAAWEALSEVQPGVTVGVADNGTVIVTARVPILRVEFVRQQPFVVSLKASQPLRPILAATTRETGCRPDLLPTDVAPDGGRGVVVGIVDFGGDFAHENFRREDGTSRVEILWSQGSSTRPDAVVQYGRVFRQAEINAALTQPDPYQALGYGPVPDHPALPPNAGGTHGTHVMDIAAGNGRGSGVPGCAPAADLIFVDLLANDVPFGTSDAVGTSFGDSVQFLEALRFVFDQAGSRPCVVNVSLGTNGGSHDGRSLVEQGMDTLLRAAPDRAIVVAASNSYADGIHAAGSVPAGGSVDLSWDIPAGVGVDKGAELEVWLPASRRLAVELIAPDGSALPVVEPGDNSSSKDQGQVVIYLANRLADPATGDNTIGVFVASVFPDGRWTVRLHDRSGDGQPVSFHAWIERYDGAQSSFSEPRDNTHTLGSISCGLDTVVVGSYDAHKASLPLSYFSSAGPTRDGRQKPEISAPGHAVVAAQSRTRTGTTTKSGTSMAAPAVCGMIALLFAEARRSGVSLPIARTRQLLIENARKEPPPGIDWDSRHGYGRVSATILSSIVGDS